MKKINNNIKDVYNEYVSTKKPEIEEKGLEVDAINEICLKIIESLGE